MSFSWGMCLNRARGSKPIRVASDYGIKETGSLLVGVEAHYVLSVVAGFFKVFQLREVVYTVVLHNEGAVGSEQFVFKNQLMNELVVFCCKRRICKYDVELLRAFLEKGDYIVSKDLQLGKA